MLCVCMCVCVCACVHACVCVCVCVCVFHVHPPCVVYLLVCALQSALCRLTYLLDVHTFAEEEMDMNRVTLLLPKQLDPIFIENERVREEGQWRGEGKTGEGRGGGVEGGERGEGGDSVQHYISGMQHAMSLTVSFHLQGY